MKANLLVKTLIPAIVMTAAPIAIVSMLSLSSLSMMRDTAVAKIEAMKESAVTESINSLYGLGKTLIKNQGLAAAQAVNFYLEAHPEMTSAELIADPEFQKIAIQPVGETGYTTVIIARTQVLLAHPNTSLMGVPVLEGLLKRPEMQEWWKIVQPTLESVENEGYYRWPESDGTYSDKYMYIATIETPTADGLRLNVAATTYINEFSAPAQTMRQQLEDEQILVISEINRMMQQVWRITVGALVVLVTLAILMAYWISRRITRPIIALTAASKRFAAGNFTSAIKVPRTSDEVNQLSDILDVLRKELKASRENLEGLVSARTKELEQARNGLERLNAELHGKLKELERVNNLLSGRELRLAELKAEVAMLRRQLGKGKKI